MSSLAKLNAEPAEVAVIEGVMGGEPVIRGTRIPVETVLIYLVSGSSARIIYEDYPTLPVGSMEAAEAWATAKFGTDWRNRVGPNGFLS